jgi:hypothetical protein
MLNAENNEPAGATDGYDGRPEIANNDRLLARLKKIHGEPRYGLAVPLKGPPTLRKRLSNGRSHAVGKTRDARDVSRNVSR